MGLFVPGVVPVGLVRRMGVGKRRAFCLEFIFSGCLV